MAINTIAPFLSAVYEAEEEKDINEDLLFKVENKVRIHFRLRDTSKKTNGNNPAFSTSNNNSNNNSNSNNSNKNDSKPEDGSNSTFRNKKQPPSPCFCDGPYWKPTYYYVRPDLRPKDWKPNPEKQKKVEEALKDKTTKEKLDKAIIRQKEIEAERKKRGTGQKD